MGTSLVQQVQRSYVHGGAHQVRGSHSQHYMYSPQPNQQGFTGSGNYGRMRKPLDDWKPNKKTKNEHRFKFDGSIAKCN